MSWLPEDYKEPVVSNYMEFELGANTFRVLDEPVMGLEYWKTKVVEGRDKRYPVRVKPETVVQIEELEVNPKTDELDMPKFFWAFPVYNYDLKRIQILEIKQKTIRKGMEDYINNPKWGEPTDYDCIVNKVKEGGKTSYTVTVNPKEEMDLAVVKQYMDMNINMKALFSGDDPFMASKPKVDGGIDEQAVKEIFDKPKA